MLGFALRGFFQGILRQVFDLIGWIGGIASCLWVSQWVGAHWNGARPAVVFGALGWLIAVLVALAVKALFEVAGRHLAKGAGESGIGIADRLGGLVLGTGIGIALVSALVIGMLLAPWPASIARAAADSKASGVVLGAAGVLRSMNVPGVSGSGVLRRALDEADRKAGRLSRDS